MVVYKDGRKVQFDPNTGIRIEAWPDGRRIETHRDGHSVEIAADGTRTDYDADGNIITRASEKRAAQAFNVEELKKKHAKDDREDETANDSTGGDGGAAAKSESLDLDLDRLISEFQLSANLKSTFESSELESHLCVFWATNALVNNTFVVAGWVGALICDFCSIFVSVNWLTCISVHTTPGTQSRVFTISMKATSPAKLCLRKALRPRSCRR